MSYTSIVTARADINQYIVPNGNQEIDGTKMNDALNSIIDLIAGAGYTFLGVATPSTTPSTPITDAKYFYLAVQSGTYTNFNALSFDGLGVGILKWNGAWSLERLPIPHGVFQITYSDLKALRDNSQLIVGQEYEITDYEAKFTGLGTHITSGHQFNIIVKATKVNELSEIARAAKIVGDTYFSENNLTAWRLWYCLDNDTVRFSKCNASGKGYIYRMIDEYNNDLPYDFKSVKFFYNGTYRFTFYDPEGEKEDSSINARSYNNFMSPNIDDGQAIAFYRNVLGVAHDNRIGCDFSENLFSSVAGTTFGEGCASNVGEDITNCVIGAGFKNNTLGLNFHDNVIGQLCNNNTIGMNFYENNIGSQFDTNTIGNLCIGCTFGNRVRNITTQGNIYRCSFGNGCRNITFQRTYAEFIEFSSGVEYIQLNTTTGGGTANQLRYFTILPSVSGTSGSVRTITLDRNNTLYHFVDWDGNAENQICLATIGQ